MACYIHTLGSVCACNIGMQKDLINKLTFKITSTTSIVPFSVNAEVVFLIILQS